MVSTHFQRLLDLPVDVREKYDLVRPPNYPLLGKLNKKALRRKYWSAGRTIGG